MLIKLKIAKLLFVFGKILEFKFVTLVAINTVVNLIKLFWDWKKSKSDNVVYTYDQSYHQHHYDEHDVEPYSAHEQEGQGWFDGLWSRTGGQETAHKMAYRAQKPVYTTIPNYAKNSPRP